MIEQPISLSPRAAQRIADIVRTEAKPLMLRVAVSGGGCSGFQYSFSLDDTKSDGDIVVERDGAALVVDAVSLEFLKGSEIDFVESLMGRSFEVKNPNAKSSCGCGSSFSI